MTHAAVVAALAGLALAAEPPRPAAPAPAPAAAKVELPPARPLPTSRMVVVPAPDDNPTTSEKAELGWMLFFSKTLSKDGSMACAGCHLPDRAYTSPNATDAKVGGAMNKRNAPSMVNMGYATAYYWDGRVPTLEATALAAWKGQLGADPAEVVKKLAANPTWKAYFQRAFGEDPSGVNVPKALAAFFRTLATTDSAWDKYQAGDKKALKPDAVKGFEVFKRTGCANCHVPPVFSDFDFHRITAKPKPEGDQGRKDATKADDDAGKFKTPSLRNVAVTGPYFHDGSLKTLDEALTAMHGGMAKVLMPDLDPKLVLAPISKQEKAQLLAFLESLTSSNTWPKAPEKLPE